MHDITSVTIMQITVPKGKGEKKREEKIEREIEMKMSDTDIGCGKEHGKWEHWRHEICTG